MRPSFCYRSYAFALDPDTRALLSRHPKSDPSSTLESSPCLCRLEVHVAGMVLEGTRGRTYGSNAISIPPRTILTSVLPPGALKLHSSASNILLPQAKSTKQRTRSSTSLNLSLLRHVLPSRYQSDLKFHDTFNRCCINVGRTRVSAGHTPGVVGCSKPLV